MSSTPPTEDQGLNLLIYPSSLQNASRVMKIATSLQRSGLFVETHAVGIGTSELAVREEIAAGVFIVRIQGSERSGNLGRVLKMLLWQPRVFLAYRGRHVTSVAAHSLAVLPLAAFIARKTGAMLVYNPHELETETDTKTGLKRTIARWIERRYIRRVEVVSAVNSSIAGWYSKEYQIETPIAVMNVPVDDGSESTLRQELGLSYGDMLYVHSGSLGPGRNIPLILREFGRRPQLQLVFLGDGPLSDLVEAAASKCQNIRLLPPVGPYAVVGQLRGADVGLCLIETNNSLNMRFATPNKFFEALFANTPSLTSDLVEVKAVLGGLASIWALEDPERQLGAALDLITQEDVALFRTKWSGFPGWDAQVAPLVDAYRASLRWRILANGDKLEKSLTTKSPVDGGSRNPRPQQERRSSTRAIGRLDHDR